jgi:phosphatidylinositol alpha-mannosyltransferase
VLLRAWPDVRRQTGATLHVIGADPRAVRLLMTRQKLSDEGIELMGVMVGDPLTSELARAKLLCAPSLGGESFGMVLTRAFGCATPVVASDIPGYDQVMAPEVGLTVPPGDSARLGEALVELLSDEERRQRLGEGARERALERYGWAKLAERLAEIYRTVVERAG